MGVRSNEQNRSQTGRSQLTMAAILLKKGLMIFSYISFNQDDNKKVLNTIYEYFHFEGGRVAG